MNISLQIYCFAIRSILHLGLSAVLYFALWYWFKIPKVHYFFIILPIVVIIEYYQYQHQVADNINKLILARDTLSLIIISITLAVLINLKDSITFNSKMMIIILLIAVIGIFNIIIEQHKPNGYHIYYKHYIDVAAYLLGPFIGYPLLTKFIFRG